MKCSLPSTLYRSVFRIATFTQFNDNRIGAIQPGKDAMKSSHLYDIETGTERAPPPMLIPIRFVSSLVKVTLPVVRVMPLRNKMASR